MKTIKTILATLILISFFSCKKKSPDKCYDCSYSYRYQFVNDYGNQIEVIPFDTISECGDKANEIPVEVKEGKFTVNGEEIEGTRELSKHCRKKD